MHAEGIQGKKQGRMIVGGAGEKQRVRLKNG